MTYRQLVQPNLSIVGQSGLCLAYVRAVFGASFSYPSATVGWQNAQYKHDGPPPAGVSVPVWFRYNGPDGHVAVWDGSRIHSTSAQGMKTFGSTQELCNWMGEGMTYLGWSEDVDQLRVVQEEEVPTYEDLTTARLLAYFMAGRLNALDGGADADLKANHVGAEVEKDIYSWYISAEGQAWKARLATLPKLEAAAKTSSDQKLQQIVADLEAEVAKYKE